MDRDSVILKGLAELDAFAAGCMKSAKRVRGLQEGLISHGTLRKPSKEQRLLIHLLTLLGWWWGGSLASPWRILASVAGLALE